MLTDVGIGIIGVAAVLVTALMTKSKSYCPMHGTMSSDVAELKQDMKKLVVQTTKIATTLGIQDEEES